VEVTGKAAVLVADDEPMLLRLVQRILSAHGWTVVPASNGDEALAQLHAREATDPVQAVVLDVAMPPEGGAATLERLLALRPDLGVVITSGVAPPPELRARLDSRGGVFLQKPFGPDALLHAVEKALAGRAPAAAS
jgi:DNA-binding NtrC family response regulator